MEAIQQAQDMSNQPVLPYIFLRVLSFAKASLMPCLDGLVGNSKKSHLWNDSFHKETYLDFFGQSTNCELMAKRLNPKSEEKSDPK